VHEVVGLCKQNAGLRRETRYVLHVIERYNIEKVHMLLFGWQKPVCCSLRRFLIPDRHVYV
jgi:hypothetical protein